MHKPTMLQFLKRYLKNNTSIYTNAAVNKRNIMALSAADLAAALEGTYKRTLRNMSLDLAFYGIEPDANEIAAQINPPGVNREQYTYEQVYTVFRGSRRRPIKMTQANFNRFIGNCPRCDIIPTLSIINLPLALNLCRGVYFVDRYTKHLNTFAFDSYMLDADELQLGAFRFIGS